MNFLIDLYDNSLIYYPNIFFAVLFFISILVIIVVSIGIIVLWGKIRRVIRKIKSNLKEIRRVRRNEISFDQTIRVFFQRKSIFLVYIIRALTVFFIHMVRVIFIRINTVLGYIESQTEKIIKKIEKEVFVQE